MLLGSRVVAELGADAIKTFHTCDFRKVTAACPVPVFGLGAEKLPTPAGRPRAGRARGGGGAGGVVFGRNAIQVPDPSAFQAALCDVVKHGKTAADACREHQLEELMDVLDHP